MSATNNTQRVALIVGAGAGNEVVGPVLELLDAAGSSLEFEQIDVPSATADSPEDYLDEAVEAVKRHGHGLKTRLGGTTRGAAWHTGRARIEAGGGAARVLYRGLRDRAVGEEPDRFSFVDDLALLTGCEAVQLLVELEMPVGGGEAWVPPRIDAVTLSWDVPR